MTERGEGGAEPVVTPVAAVLRAAALGGGVACSRGTKDSRRQLIGGAASRRSGLGAELGVGLLCASSARGGGVSSAPPEDGAPHAASPASAPHGESAGPLAPPLRPPWAPPWAPPWSQEWAPGSLFQAAAA